MGTRQGYLLSLRLFNTILEGLVSAVKATAKNETKVTLIGKEEIKLSQFAADIIVFIENPKESTEKTPITNEFYKVAGYEINTQISLHNFKTM